ncbi:MAG: hypothetical protein ACQETO_13445, partial [Pseudomonadota bacterium]
QVFQGTSAAYHASVLGVATLSYAPWAFFCLISPAMTLLFAWRRIRIARIPDNSNGSHLHSGKVAIE